MDSIKKKRGLALAAGLVSYVCLGFLYSWSNYVAYMENDEGWSRTGIAAAFTICIIMFGVGCFMGGTLAKKLGNIRVIRLGALLLMAGLFGAGLSQNLGMLYLFYGGFYGISLGLTYVPIMPLVHAWFPERIGLISGVLLMFYGFGGTIMGEIAMKIVLNSSWETAFKTMGILIFVLIVVSSAFLTGPGEKEAVCLAGIAESSDKKKQSAKETKGITKEADGNEETLELNLKGMLKRKSFWYYYFWFTFLSCFWLGAVGQTATFALDMGASVRVATLTAGSITFCNGAGRIVVGWLHDHVSRRKIMMGITFIMLAASVLVYISLVFGILWLLIPSVGFIGISYGAAATTNPVFIRRFYGTKNYSQNYGIVNTNGMFSAFLGSSMGPILIEKSGNYHVMMIYFIALLVISFVFQWKLRRP